MSGGQRGAWYSSLDVELPEAGRAGGGAGTAAKVPLCGAGFARGRVEEARRAGISSQAFPTGSA